jgi:hypothetical protein
MTIKVKTIAENDGNVPRSTIIDISAIAYIRGSEDSDVFVTQIALRDGSVLWALSASFAELEKALELQHGKPAEL